MEVIHAARTHTASHDLSSGQTHPDLESQGCSSVTLCDTGGTACSCTLCLHSQIHTHMCAPLFSLLRLLLCQIILFSHQTVAPGTHTQTHTQMHTHAHTPSALSMALLQLLLALYFGNRLLSLFGTKANER